MKKFLFTAMLAMMSLTWVSCESKVILEGELHQTAHSFVQQHFADYTVGQLLKDWDHGHAEYEVFLSQGADLFVLDFNHKGEIKSIDSKSKTALPESVIPAKILEYTVANYPANFIIEWDKDKRDQSVELNNGIDLVFSLAGDFLRIDY